MAGLHDELRPGKPRSIEDERLAELIWKTLHTKPATGTHWSVRDMALETGLSKSAVHRFFQLFGLKPHRQESFKLSTDPFFIEKVRDVVGLYLSPPDKALVLCVDEKSQVQALERTQPLPPLGFGYAEGVTHDYERHGTTTLFAALNVLDGSVIAQCKPRHRHQEFLAFLRHIEAAVPADLDIHLICDNYATHKHAKVKAWLAARPRWQVHFTPTYAAGSTRSSAFSPSSPIRPSGGARLPVFGNWSATSTTSSPITTSPAAPSSGPPRPIPSWPNFNDYVSELMGQDTRSSIVDAISLGSHLLNPCLLSKDRW